MMKWRMGIGFTKTFDTGVPRGFLSQRRIVSLLLKKDIELIVPTG